MLISFSVSNYRSFRDEKTLSMTASRRQTGHESHLLTAPGLEDRFLPTAVIYGANGSGKSNLVKALRFVETFVLKGSDRNEAIPYTPFRFDEHHPTQPSTFEVRYSYDGHVFNFGFSLDQKRIASEWLALLEGGREVQLYERITSPEGKTTVELGNRLQSAKSDYAKIFALQEIGPRANQLFLNAIFDSIANDDQGPLFNAAINWFEKCLHIIFPQANFSKLVERVSDDKDFATFISKFLHESATGVSDLNAVTSDMDAESVPPGFLELIANDEPSEGAHFPAGIPGAELIVANATTKEFKIRAIATTHIGEGGKAYHLPFFEESDGTCRLTNLLPALHKLNESQRVYIIDEIDRSLHPLLAHKFVESFLRIAKKSGSQLIITTHETNLMDLDLLRRDELWLTEKDSLGASDLYSLSEYKIRNDLQIQKGYLCGRFGAIPFLGNVDRLMNELVGSAKNEPTKSEA